jgi:hypothetical protein
MHECCYPTYWVTLLKLRNPTLDEIRIDHKFISRGRPHLSMVELSSTQILIWYQSLSKICWATCYQVIAIGTLRSHSKCLIFGASGVKSLTLDEISLNISLYVKEVITLQTDFLGMN